MAETINSLKQSKYAVLAMAMTSRCSDNALIQENTIQKNKITSLKKQVFIQNQKLQELKETLKEYKVRNVIKELTYRMTTKTY